jgi:peptidoglycan/xylan/chitin deacetylase (PgdA/CDA1 family)
VKNALLNTGIAKLVSAREKGASVAILRYHAVVDPEDNYYACDSICVTPAQFKRQLSYISEHFSVVSLDTVAQCIMENTPFPENAVVITFDDGYRDNYNAYKIMSNYGLPGTFYVSAGCLSGVETFWLFEVMYLLANTNQLEVRIATPARETKLSLATRQERNVATRKIVEIIKSNDLQTREEIREQLRNRCRDVKDLDEKKAKVMLTWEQVREMSQNGMTIGGHTLTHLNLPNASKEDAVKEIKNCKTLIEKQTGKTVRHFSYPNGGNYQYYNSSVVRIVQECGYTTATTSNNGLVNLSSHLHKLNRVRITPHISEIVYQICCEPLVSRFLRFG